MKSFTLVLASALLFAAAGCKKTGPDCGKAIDHSMELSKTEMQKMGMDDATMQKMKDLGVQHCKDDKWPADAVQCMVDAKTMADAQACYGKLSKEQRESMNQAAMAAAKPTGGGAGSAPADTGSGSAAAPK